MSAAAGAGATTASGVAAPASVAATRRIAPPPPPPVRPPPPPPLPPRGHRRVTAASPWRSFHISRRADLCEVGPDDARRILVGHKFALSSDIAVDRAIMTLGDGKEAAALGDLVLRKELLRGLPLALELAGNYMRVTGCSFARYRKLFLAESVRRSDFDAPIVDAAAAAGVPAHASHTVATAWRLSSAQLCSGARQLLGVLSFLAPNADISTEVVGDFGQLVSPQGVGRATDAAAPNRVRPPHASDISELIALSLVRQQQPRGAATAVRVHRLTQVFTRESLSPAARTRAQAAACEALATTMRRWDMGLPRAARAPFFAAVPHASSLLGHMRHQGRSAAHSGTAVAKQAVELCWRTADVLRKGLSRHGEGRTLLESMLSVAQRTGDHAGTCKLLSRLGYVCEISDDIPAAQRFFEQWIARERAWAAARGECEDSEDLAGALRNLGDIRKKQGRLAEAESLYRQSLEMTWRINGSGVMDINVAHALSQLGNLCRERGKLQEAEDLHMQSLKMKRAWYSDNPSHPHIALSHHNLGEVCLGRARLQEARRHFEAAVEMLRAVHGEAGHPYIAWCLNGLGKAKERAGEPGKAAELYEQAWELQAKCTSGDHSLAQEFRESYERLRACA